MTVRPGVGPVPIAAGSLARDIATALEATDAPGPASVGLILADDAELARLNEEHLGGSGPTDVLSFPLLPPSAYPAHEAEPADRRAEAVEPATPAFRLPAGRRRHLGDIVVSLERASEQARIGRGGHTGDVAWSVAEELRLLVTHGTLHLCGWDHAEPDEEAGMRALERRLLGRRRRRRPGVRA